MHSFVEVWRPMKFKCFIPKFQIGVMKWCLLELFNKIIGA